jgi:hypothetical protein
LNDGHGVGRAVARLRDYCAAHAGWSGIVRQSVVPLNGSTAIDSMLHGVVVRLPHY